MLYYIKLDVKEIARPADTLYNFQLYNFLPIKFISLQSIVLKVKDNLPSSPLSLYMYLIYCFSHQPNISTLFLLSFNKSVHKLLINMNKT